ncbi:unnamed protein product [Caenorhabditis bovis]|uniref:Uncharacterized protein n=1 Tax=Caenorhabditis bovis TaxID=2654633 RepID=A0A8S1EM19_9PELO|nr:unnamed protein product [Caenorhabditis bovis]
MIEKLSTGDLRRFITLTYADDDDYERAWINSILARFAARIADDVVDVRRLQRQMLASLTRFINERLNGASIEWSDHFAANYRRFLIAEFEAIRHRNDRFRRRLLTFIDVMETTRGKRMLVPNERTSSQIHQRHDEASHDDAVDIGASPMLLEIRRRIRREFEASL